MQGDFASSILLPGILVFVMFSLGLGLRVADFVRIVRQPRALLVGMLCHFVLLPLVCFAMLKLFGLTGAFAVGFMILAACPTGSTSNLLTYIARGDVALAISFTAVASVVTIATLPAIVAWSLHHFLGASQTVAVPVGAMMGQVLLLVGLPAALGMAARHRWPDWAQRFEPKATRISTLLFVLIVVFALVKNRDVLKDHFWTLAPFAIGLNLVMLALGFATAWLARLSRRQSITLGIEASIQSATLAIVIASSILGNDTMLLPAAVYGVLMYAGGLAFAAIARRYAEGSESMPPSSEPVPARA